MVSFFLDFRIQDVKSVLEFKFFFLNLSNEILSDLDLEPQLFNVMEICDIGCGLKKESGGWKS